MSSWNPNFVFIKFSCWVAIKPTGPAKRTRVPGDMDCNTLSEPLEAGGREIREFLIPHPLIVKVWHIYSDSLPSVSGLIMVSKKGMGLSSLLSSIVNLMARSTLLMCWRKFCLISSLWTIQVSSTYLSHVVGGWVAIHRAFCLKYFMYRLATRGLTGDPIAAPSTCS